MQHQADPIDGPLASGAREWGAGGEERPSPAEPPNMTVITPHSSASNEDGEAESDRLLFVQMAVGDEKGSGGVSSPLRNAISELGQRRGGRCSSPARRAIFRRQTGVLLVTAAVFTVILTSPLGFGDGEAKTEQPAQRCLAILFLSAVLWATELIPSHITALLIPLLMVTLKVCCVPRHIRDRTERGVLMVPPAKAKAQRQSAGTALALVRSNGHGQIGGAGCVCVCVRVCAWLGVQQNDFFAPHGQVPVAFCNSSDPGPGQVMPPDQAATVALSSFFNPLIALFLAGFVMSTVFEQYGLSARLAASLLRRAGSNPGTISLMLMVFCVVGASPGTPIEHTSSHKSRLTC